MKRLLATVIASVALLGASAVEALPPPTHVTITEWVVKTTNGKSHTVAPGSTFKHCPNVQAASVNAKGSVAHAKVGKKYSVYWTLNGLNIATFPHQWGKTDGPVHFFLTRNLSHTVPDGNYLVSIIQDGKSIGHSTLTVGKRKHC